MHNVNNNFTNIMEWKFSKALPILSNKSDFMLNSIINISYIKMTKAPISYYELIIEFEYINRIRKIVK